ncbi:hypothetical protein TRFO_22031 [Tritrichomonas foetus]|uniref:DUF3447 domain-containing protein n=1 Tax=Tritrichomonas foetus TaxID=1144522 RepID=A0A1J4KIQ8_9EUKA|nr:hypothetical protein TRFO_22031 [Tritrichomonas foetus]|eukprot:OHT09197.1 hypothetical protein TRFO_22031 [Tritrichomonas foetus]
MIRPSNRNLSSLIREVLNELILHNSLIETFHQSTLYFIFKTNNSIVLYLIENKIIDLPFIVQQYSKFKKTFLNLQEKITFCFFIPELKTVLDSQDFNTIAHSYGISQILSVFKQPVYDYCSENEEKRQNYIFCRKNGHSNIHLAKIIQNDDIDAFLSYINDENNTFFLDPVFESNFELCKCSILEYSMAFGSINIFKYLWTTKKEQFSQNSLKYSIIGGNYEIIHILAEESPFTFDKDCLKTAIKYHQYEIMQYLINSLSLTLSTEETINVLVKFSSYDILDQIFSYYDNSLLFNVNSVFIHSVESLEVIPIFLKPNTTIGLELLPYFCYQFLLQQPRYDCNIKDFIRINTHC